MSRISGSTSGIGTASLRNNAALGVIGALLMVGGCADRAVEAEKQYEMVKRFHPSAAELCSRGDAMVSAYLEAGNENKYQEKATVAAIECQRARLDER